eukprot:TRINITY_DN65762_c0_g1_i1.p1 TRINITY_DN65762_c0_g1~~TRINITY_DN65762_c0_g1_i1.p1  ORF type:complete len:196 (-),score=43.30 TRINITY_DN65762_c0_g1_i1:26-613(-)
MAAAAPKGSPAGAGEAPKKSAAEILAAFRNRVDRKIAGEPEPGAKEEAQEGQTLYLTTSAAVQKRREVEDQARHDRHAGKDFEANGRGKKRSTDELPSQRKRERPAHLTVRIARKKKAKISNMPPGIEFKYLQELLEKACGPITEGYVNDSKHVAYLRFEQAEDAQTLYDDFNGGEISGKPIEVELLSDSESIRP